MAFPCNPCRQGSQYKKHTSVGSLINWLAKLVGWLIIDCHQMIHQAPDMEMFLSNFNIYVWGDVDKLRGLKDTALPGCHF